MTVAVGIDKIGFDTPGLVLDLVSLAKQRGDEPDKYTIGIGQDQQAVVPNYEDVVTMGVNAAQSILTDADRQDLDMLIFATESGVDNSKSAAVFAQQLLDLPVNIRTIELKQACYAGTYGLMQARDYVTLHPDRKVLVIAADIARYGLATPGEVTQGAGAVAMLVAANPRLAVIHDDSVFMSQDTPDFWRPIDRSQALVDGHLSTDVYKAMFAKLWQRYQDQTGLDLNQIDGWAFHLPYTKMAKKALDQVIDQADDRHQDLLKQRLAASQAYSRRVGNTYTASVYMSLLSLLANDDSLQAGDRLGIFSYGSGAEAELFSLSLVPGFEDQGPKTAVNRILDRRQLVSVPEYERIFSSQLLDSTVNSRSAASPRSLRAQFWGWQDGQRLYQVPKDEL